MKHEMNKQEKCKSCKYCEKYFIHSLTTDFKLYYCNNLCSEHFQHTFTEDHLWCEYGEFDE